MCSTSIIGGWGRISAPQGRSGVRKKSLKESEEDRRRKSVASAIAIQLKGYQSLRSNVKDRISAAHDNNSNGNLAPDRDGRRKSASLEYGEG